MNYDIRSSLFYYLFYLFIYSEIKRMYEIIALSDVKYSKLIKLKQVPTLSTFISFYTQIFYTYLNYLISLQMNNKCSKQINKLLKFVVENTPTSKYDTVRYTIIYDNIKYRYLGDSFWNFKFVRFVMVRVLGTYISS